MNRIPFNKSIFLYPFGKTVLSVLEESSIAGDGRYTSLCSEWFEKRFAANRVLLTSSCTSALEMAAILLGVKNGDEVIMPSYTFVSTANAFVMRGAKPVFVDIRPDTMNIDESLIENAITEKTKAIVVVHYAGVSCEMDRIMEIANRYSIPVIEDAAQAVMSMYKGRYLGTIGTFGCYSFHETKNYTMGEGGALVINDKKYIERAEIIREKGTDRSRFYRGEVDKYTWCDVGSSYLPSEINVSFLWGQLLIADEINDNRLNSWNHYYNGLIDLSKSGRISLPVIPAGCVHNAHMFYIKCANQSQRKNLLEKARERQIGMVFHYVPLHSSMAGMKYGRFVGEDVYTTVESERIVRLPLYYGISDDELDVVLNTLNDFWG